MVLALYFVQVLDVYPGGLGLGQHLLAERLVLVTHLAHGERSDPSGRSQLARVSYTLHVSPVNNRETEGLHAPLMTRPMRSGRYGRTISDRVSCLPANNVRIITTFSSASLLAFLVVRFLFVFQIADRY